MALSVKPIQLWFPLPDAKTSLYTTGRCSDFLLGKIFFVPAVRGVARGEQSAVSFLGILSAAENCPPHQGQTFSRMLRGSEWRLFMTVDPCHRYHLRSASPRGEVAFYYYLSKTAHYSRVPLHPHSSPRKTESTPIGHPAFRVTLEVIPTCLIIELFRFYLFSPLSGGSPGVAQKTHWGEYIKVTNN